MLILYLCTWRLIYKHLGAVLIANRYAISAFVNPVKFDMARRAAILTATQAFRAIRTISIIKQHL